MRFLIWSKTYLRVFKLIQLSNDDWNIRLSSDCEASKLFTKSIVFSGIFAIVQWFQIIYVGGGWAIVEFIFHFTVVDIGGRLVRIGCSKILQSFFVVIFTENLIFAEIESVANTKSKEEERKILCWLCLGIGSGVWVTMVFCLIFEIMKLLTEGRSSLKNLCQS